MRSILLIALAILMAAPATATAARVPYVRDVSITYAPCPDADAYFAHAAGCTWPGASTVYVNPDQPSATRRWFVWHELGHQFAFQVLGPGGVLKFAHLTRWTDHGPRDQLIVTEQVADAYASCALNLVPRPTYGGDRSGEYPTGYGYQPTPSTYRAVCAMFTRAGHRAGLQ